MKTLIKSVLVPFLLVAGFGLQAANGAPPFRARLIGCSVSVWDPAYLVKSSAVAAEIGQECEEVVNELLGAGFGIQSVVTPGGAAGAVVVYNLQRPGRH